VKVTCVIPARGEIKEVLNGCESADLGGFGTFFVSTDDDASLAVLVTDDGEHLYNLYTQLNAIQGITKHVYLVVVGTGFPSQFLAIQEMGIFTVSLDSYDRLTGFIKFIAQPKRRQEKKLLPARNIRVFTPAEQILMTIPGLGPAKVGSILNYYGSLANAMSVLSWYDGDLDMPGVVSKQTIHDWREILGLPDGNIILNIPIED